MQAHESYCKKTNRKGIIKRDGDDATAYLYENGKLIHTLTGYEYKDDISFPRPISRIVDGWVFEKEENWQ